MGNKGSGPKEHLAQENPEILNDPTIIAWLNEFANSETRKQYRSRIVKFFATLGKLPKDVVLMDKKAIKQLILDYQNNEKKTREKTNGILSELSAFRSYLISIEKEVTFRKGQLLNTEADNDSHIFTNGDLKKMFDVGNTFEKALLATAVSEGWEISMFLEQSRSKIERLIAHAAQNEQKYIFFRDQRDKTGAARLCVLNPLAIEWLSKYLSLRKEEELEDTKKNQEATPGKDDQNELEAKILKEKYKDQLFPITPDGVQKMLYRLAKDADLKTTGNLRFHNIRKWLMSRLSRCSFNEFQIKFIMGKTIPVSDSTYLQTLQEEIEEKYPVVYNDYLNLVPKPSGHQIFTAEEIEQIRVLLKLVKAGKVKIVE